MQDALKDAGHGMSAGRRHERLRAMLVVSEVALACLLLVGAGLLLRSFLRVLDVDLGFQPSRSAAIKIDYNDAGKPERRSAILQIGGCCGHATTRPQPERGPAGERTDLQRGS
ncbi:MAG: hypothetical protein ABSG65_01180 [Bryobacteraceae bacterium]